MFSRKRFSPTSDHFIVSINMLSGLNTEKWGRGVASGIVEVVLLIVKINGFEIGD